MSNLTSKLGLALSTLGDTVFKKSFSTNMAILDAAVGTILTGSKTFDPASAADAVGETTTVTVTGAVLGDFVTGVSFDKDLAGTTVTGYVSAADTVSVRFQNESGGALNLASGTLRVLVRKA